MNVSEFDAITKAVISPLLEAEHGFLFVEGTFVRDFPKQVRHVVMFDFDVVKKNTFRVMVGFNSPIITGELSPNEAGVLGVRYLSESGLSDVPTNFPCFKKEIARQSLTRVKTLLTEHAIPWMSLFDSLEKIADVVEEQYPFIKGKLYFSVGAREKAKTYLSRHLSYLTTRPRTSEVVRGIEETKEMLKQCESR